MAGGYDVFDSVRVVEVRLEELSVMRDGGLELKLEARLWEIYVPCILRKAGLHFRRDETK